MSVACSKERVFNTIAFLFRFYVYCTLLVSVGLGFYNNFGFGNVKDKCVHYAEFLTEYENSFREKELQAFCRTKGLLRRFEDHMKNDASELSYLRLKSIYPIFALLIFSSGFWLRQFFALDDFISFIVISIFGIMCIMSMNIFYNNDSRYFFNPFDMQHKLFPNTYMCKLSFLLPAVSDNVHLNPTLDLAFYCIDPFNPLYGYGVKILYILQSLITFMAITGSVMSISGLK